MGWNHQLDKQQYNVTETTHVFLLRSEVSNMKRAKKKTTI